MANKLLAERNIDPVGKHWPNNFVARSPALKTRMNRSYDYKRAMCEDPEVIEKWFELVKNVKAKYGIVNEDIYNFDETGFQMGMISSQTIITDVEKRNRPKAIQPGDREWITVIQGINATGWTVPPFLIFKGKHHLSAWYEDLQKDWAIGVSANGWTTNELGIEWLEHFDRYTKNRCMGTRQLLIFDGHESHNSFEFLDRCKQKDIIALCMPPHASHLLQPLDVGCFAPLKKAYGDEVGKLIHNHITHVDKLSFLSTFKTAFDRAFTKDNISASFRGAGLVPLNATVVLAKLDVKLRTPSPSVEELLWESKTPSNPRELEAQSTLLHNRIQRHQDSSPSSIVGSLKQLTKGAVKMSHEIVLLRNQVHNLVQANEAATKRKSRKRKRIQQEGTLTGEQGSILSAQRFAVVVEMNKRRKKESIDNSITKSQRHCRRCGDTGHNTRTCGNDRIDIE